VATDSMRKATSPAPIGHQGLWKTPGEELPAYIQHVRNRLMREQGIPEAKATRLAIGIIKNWAHRHPSGGEKTIHPDTVAAAQLALKQWEALKAKHGGGKRRR
jgi:hypothetical protein